MPLTITPKKGRPKKAIAPSVPFSFVKDQHYAPEMETMIVDKLYTFNLNPPDTDIRGAITDDKKLFRDCVSHQIDDTVILRKRILRYHKDLHSLKYCTIDYYPELSHTGRIHFHGTIKIHNILLFYYIDLSTLKSMGHYCIDTIDDLKIREIYQTKQISLFECVFKKTAYSLPLKIIQPNLRPENLNVQIG